MENSNDIYISDAPSDYGSKGQTWSEEFVKYMKYIATHPIYSGMPDAIKEDGKIQWEAPSNRSSGKYQLTHQKRRQWWQEKAKSLGIDITTDKWISKTAKLIHPTGEKPCKRCGRIMQIGYAYPNENLIKKIKTHFNLDVTPTDHIVDIIQETIDILGIDCLSQYQKVLNTSKVKVPEFGQDVDAFLLWIKDIYIPSEPSSLSPGVMSNAPDRFDGFHSFNRCCRGIADKGRSTENLKSYTTDRRVFEFWSDGDWVGADRLMGLVRTKLNNAPTADGGGGAPTADHIGPLSLGFCHRPEFRLLSKEANSAKNNRMTSQDVRDLITVESQNIKVISWHSEYLWNLRKHDVNNEEKALRLSKMLRDNQRNAMIMLSSLHEKGAYTFLAYLLNLQYADFKVVFENLRSENFITKFDSIVKEKRETKYSSEQKARRLRIGFEALRSYKVKENRHLIIIKEEALNLCIEKIITLFNENAQEFREIDKEIETILIQQKGVLPEMSLRELVNKIPQNTITVFEKAKEILQMHMQSVGEYISQQWEADRYVRASFNLD